MATGTSTMSIAAFESMFMSLASNKKAYVPIGWRGPGGIGKTASFGRIAKKLSKKLAPLEFAHCAEEDAGGIPVRDAQSGQVVRLPIGPIRTACNEPSILFMDEVSRANEVKQGALLTLINERRAGDFVLHPDTIVALAFNGSNHIGAFKLIDVMRNRIVIVDALPTLDEIYTYLRGLGDVQSEDLYDVALADMAVDWAATAERTPNLIQIEPPPGSAENEEAYPSPRMCEKAVRGMAQLIVDQQPVQTLRTFLAGAVNPLVANAYFAVRALRDNLPTVKEICDEPKKAKLPQSIETAVAAMALVEQAGARNPDAAWVYADRLKQEDIRAALAKRITSKLKASTPDAIKARIGMTQTAAQAIRSAVG